MIRKIGEKQIELNKVDENTTEFLEINISHYDGKYYSFVRKVEKTKKFGYDAVSFMLCADGNFKFRIKDGRFSKKQAENLRVNLEKVGMDSVKQLWLDKSYNHLVSFVKNILLLENK